jgi:hypothetical protein
MKKFIMAFLIAFLISGCADTFSDDAKPTVPNSSVQKSEGNDPSYLYRSCKNSLSEGTFEHSACKAIIMGFLLGAGFATQAVVASKPNDPCGKRESEVVYQFQHRICAPTGVAPEKLPEDVAKKYIQWFDGRKNNQDDEIFNGLGEVSLMISISTNYNCGDMEKKNSLDNSSK